MKKYLKSAIVAIVAIAIAGFTNCNRSDGPASGKWERAFLNITLDNPTMNDGSRASGALPVDNVITNFTVFVFNGDGSLAAREHFDTNGSGDERIEVTTYAREVYVIANAGDQTANYSTKAALAETAIDLSTQYTLENYSRWATGSATLGAFSGDAIPEAEATVNLSFVAARITLTVVNNMTNTSDPNAATITNVAVLNAGGQSKLFPNSGTSLIPQSSDAGYAATSKYLEGLVVDGFQNKPTGYYSGTTGSMVDAYTVLPAGQQYYFYVFENDAVSATTFPTIVTLEATDAAHTFYFPVHLTPSENFTTGSSEMTNGIIRGHSYDVTITLSGDATTANSRGTDDPTVPVTRAEVNVDLVLGNWTPVTLGKEF